MTSALVDPQASSVANTADENTAEPLLRVENLDLAIHGTPILHDVSLQLNAGRTLGIIGESGSGKSMTALSIMQLLPRGSSMSGSIQFAGQDLSRLPESELCELRGSEIGMVFQEPMTALNPVHTIGAQVMESIRLHRRVSSAEAQRIATDTLTKVGLPADEFPLGRYPHELSGGQRQRVVIAIAVACQPALLIADEPTTALDVTTQAGILELLKSLQASEGLALILITHDLAVVANMADDVVIMQHGRVREAGPTLEVFARQQHAYTRSLFAASTFVPDRRLINTDNDGPLLQVDGLVCEYPIARERLFTPQRYFRAVNQVSFTIRHGESVGLVGESGCGKSTLSKALLGLLPITAGRIELDGGDLNRNRMQVVFQDPYGSFNPRHRVSRLVAEPLHVLDQQPSATERRALVISALESVGLQASDAEKYIHEFSGGQRQRIAIARALITRPALIILDEAVSALDVSVRAQVLELLSRLGHEHRLSYLFISHDLSVVRNVTDRVLVMRDGEIVEQGNTQTVFQSPEHEYTRSLLAAIPEIPELPTVNTLP